MMRMIGFLSLMALAGGCADTRQAKAVAQAERPRTMQVVPLRYAAAEELGRELVQTLGPAKKSGVTIVADPRTNSLIVTGESEAELAAALELIAKLDVDVAKPR